MPVLPLGASETHRTYGRLPHIRLRNMFVESDPTNQVDGLVRLQRPGLSPFATVGSGPINAVWQENGAFNDDTLVVSSARLFRVNSDGNATDVGGVNAQLAQIDGGGGRAVIVSGSAAYLTDGASVTLIAMPDGRPVGSVAYFNGYFILSVVNARRFYWIEPGLSVVDPLNFAEVERSSGAIVRVITSGDVVWFLKQSDEEPWQATGDVDAPFQRFAGRTYENGCASRDAVIEVEGSVVWVTPDGRVVEAAGTPETISSPSITQHLAAANGATMRAWFFKLATHVFYVLTTDNDTFVYDFSTKIWSRFSTHQRNTWRAHLGAGLVAGDSDTGKLWRVDVDANSDDGDNMVREISGGIEIVGSPQRANNLAFRVAVGWSPSPSFEPQLEVEWADDEANTFTAKRQIGLGKQGNYNKTATLYKLGQMQAPGRVYNFRFSDDAVFRMSYCVYDEAWN